MPEKLKLDFNHQEKNIPNNSELLGKILHLHPRLPSRMRAMVLKRLYGAGNEKSVDIDDILQQTFLKFIQASNPPREDWSEKSIVAWMAGVIKNIILGLHKMDGDLHNRVKERRIRTIQFAKSGSQEAERGILTEDKIKDNKNLPLDNLLVREHAFTPDFAEESPDSELDKQLTIDNQIRILRQKSGEENFTRAIDTLRLKNYLGGKVADLYYIEHLDYFKIAELLSTNQLKIKKIVQEASVQLFEILSK